MMTPTIKCNKFTVHIKGERDASVILNLDTQKWVVQAFLHPESNPDPTNINKEYENLEDAVNYARKIAGRKVV